MIQSPSVSTTNPRGDGELCRNACGFYGNKIWDGFCSKCYREVYQQARQIQEVFDEKLGGPNSDGTPPSSVQSSPSFSNFQEKRRSNISMRNPLRQMVSRAGNLRSSSNSALSSMTNDENTLENEAATEHLNTMTTDDARIDIKNQVKQFANSFHKKCSNKNVTIDTLVQEYGTFKDSLKKRIQADPIYRNENEDLILRVRDYLEKIIFSRNYALIFLNRIAIACEEKDLFIQNRITSLHWITAPMLDTVLNESIPIVHDAIYKAINALIELDSKTTPQGKIHSIMECKSCIEDAIRASSSGGINADSFLPALIFVVLKAKPPRIHSNIQFLSSFSQPSGEQLYYLANLDSAVRFIELLQAQHLGLSADDFAKHMRGESVLPSKFASLFESPLTNETNNQELRERFKHYHELDHHCEKFDENLLDFKRRLTQTVTDIRDLLNGTYSRFPIMEKFPQLIDVDNIEQLEDLSKITINQKDIVDILDQSTSENEQLPEPLAPEIVPQQQTKNDN